MSHTSYRRRVAVLRGGPSSEYEVSMKTGQGVINALADSSYEVKDIIISRSGEWLVRGFVKSPESALLDVDAVFIALHGAYGEDGTVQRILERLCLPYTGSRSYASSLAINKVLTKEFLKKHSDAILMPPHMKLSKHGVSSIEHAVTSIRSLFGPEYVIKPIAGGSSIGTIMADQHQLYRAVSEALDAHGEVLIEQRIRGKEATVGILENFRNEQFYDLPAIEIVPPPKASFFSEDVKYTGETEEICPGRFSTSEKRALADAAKEVHSVLGLRQYSRSDFIVNDEGVYFLEVNTLPGLTSESLFPKSMEAVGSNYRELVNHLLATV